MSSTARHPVDTKKRRDVAIRFLRNDATLADIARYLKLNPVTSRNNAAHYVCRALREAYRRGEVVIAE